MFGTLSLPYHIIEHPNFVQALTMYRNDPSSYIPSARSLRKEIIRLGNEKLQLLLDYLRNSQTPVALCIDGYTNISGAKVTNIMLIANGAAFNYDSIFNSLDNANDAMYLYRQTKPIVQQLLEKQIKVVSFTADNEAVNEVFIHKLQNDFPFIIHNPCGAHTAQLILKKICRLQPISDIYNNVMIIINQYRDLRIKVSSLV